MGWAISKLGPARPIFDQACSLKLGLINKCAWLELNGEKFKVQFDPTWINFALVEYEFV